MSNWNAATAEWYAQNYGEYPTNRLAVDRLHLAPDATVVDVGCGTGAALRQAAQQVTKGALIGIDPVARMVEIAREHSAGHAAAERMEFRQGSAEDLPIEDARADYVFAFDSFDHWQDPMQGLSEVRRVLRPGGQFVVVKDGGLPNGSAARQAFVQALDVAGFNVDKEETITEGDISFTLWICSLRQAEHYALRITL